MPDGLCVSQSCIRRCISLNRLADKPGPFGFYWVSPFHRSGTPESRKLFSCIFFIAAGDSIKGAFSQCLTVTEPSRSPALSLEIYRDRKSFAGNPLAPALGLQSGSFRRQCATRDHLVNWVFLPWPHATKSRPGNGQAQRGREIVSAHPLVPFSLFQGPGACQWSIDFNYGLSPKFLLC